MENLDQSKFEFEIQNKSESNTIFAKLRAFLIFLLFYNYYRVTLSVCSRSSGSRQDQTFSFTYKKDIHLGADPASTTCWDVQSGDGAPVLTYACHGQGGNQLWKYNVVSLMLL